MCASSVHTSEDYLTKIFSIHPKILHLARETEEEVADQLSEADRIGEYNQLKVLRAMQDNRLSDVHFAATTGYGYNDLGRDVLESIYAQVFQAETGLVRPQIISGTHALTVALFGNLHHGDELLSLSGKPYDTLEKVIGIRSTKGSLAEYGIVYKQVELLPDGRFDYENIRAAITKKTRMVTIQRSKGYAWRRSLPVDEIGTCIRFVKEIRSDIICMVDNCYGEFVETAEPSEWGADLVVGSLIKNPGGGLAPVGGYIVGNTSCVENAAYRLTAPGLGREVGPSLGVTPMLLQGLFLAPNVVAGSVKAAVFAARMFEKLGFSVLPGSGERRTDIVQAVHMQNAVNLIAFCQGIQKAAPVDSYVVPEPWDMPGYDCPVIMAAGAFVQGSSIELSADAPVKEPYNLFLQGGLTWHHAKNGLIIAVNSLHQKGYI